MLPPPRESGPAASPLWLEQNARGWQAANAKDRAT